MWESNTFENLDNNMKGFVMNYNLGEIDIKINGFEGALEKHSDGIAKLEMERSNLDGMIKNIDDNINKANHKIEESIKKKEILESNKSDNEIKQYIFDRTGFGKEQDNCKYFHAEEICTEYIETKRCTRKECRKRHPKSCRYYQRSI